MINCQSMRKKAYRVLACHTAIVLGNKTDLEEARDVQHFINTDQHAPVKVIPRRFLFHKRKGCTRGSVIDACKRHD